MFVENIQASGFEAAFKGMRNPLESWSKSDSYFWIDYCEDVFEFADFLAEQRTDTPQEKEKMYQYLLDNGIIKESDRCCEYAFIGKNDMNLAQRLIAAGPEHAKFLRQINISMDITAPLYWWKEFDTYKIGTTANSTSTMHKLLSRPFTKDMFEIDRETEALFNFEGFLDKLNCLRADALHCLENSKDTSLIELERAKYLNDYKIAWRAIVQLLPENFLQTRTVTMNYAVARNIAKQRKGHKLKEWTIFENALQSLPYAYDLIFYKL